MNTCVCTWCIHMYLQRCFKEKAAPGTVAIAWHALHWRGHQCKCTNCKENSASGHVFNLPLGCSSIMDCVMTGEEKHVGSERITRARQGHSDIPSRKLDRMICHRNRVGRNYIYPLEFDPAVVAYQEYPCTKSYI